ncbi:shikimate dehydrogenase (NADP(+)) [Ferrigenium kumadai]|uniref:Shikimate dehydrogenase (NADP(+)) n=1 Tax=Ferrigenium kumadai TaxID=1682490 RepID=A0AAN1T048_9PROT|nr:shikimate dehydrogenase [Ferrigenium kumadai]BBJ00271.1 shikimate dehydrogenase (NADP(+)) [Ferrigenium kumadai]
MTDKYAVLGNPISHSKSPLIHRMFAEQTGQDISYEAIEAPLDGFAAKIEELRAKGYKGCNVTVPFKVEAFNLANQLSQKSLEAEAVNTLKFEGDAIIGDNTDGAGLVRDIEQNLGIPLKGKRILLIGAGGAAQGVLHPILATEPKQLVISNRTPDKALALKKSVKNDVVSVEAVGFGELDNAQFDVIINATSAGLTDSEIPIPSTIFAPGALAYDMMYGRETPFMAFARQHGARVADGLGMLVEQAAEAFCLWRRVRPETKPVRDRLRLS